MASGSPEGDESIVMTEPLSVIALFGPTGVGKTSIAIELARLLRARGEDPCAVSVDSMQVYRELPVISGAPTAEEQLELEHRLIATRSVTETYNVAIHATSAHAEIDELQASGRRPIVVGGTGLYLRAALTDLDLLPPPPKGVREALEQTVAEVGQERLYKRLVLADAKVAASIDSNDKRRTIRALELLELGTAPSNRNVNRLWTADTRVAAKLYALIMDRDVLYSRIDARVDAMLAAGAQDEVKAAAEIGPGRTARQALGYTELLNDNVAAFKTNTRRYAKRQLTWLRKLAGAEVIDVTDRDSQNVAREIAAKMTG